MRVAFVVPSILPYGIQMANALSAEHEILFVTTSSGADLLPAGSPNRFHRLLRELLTEKVHLNSLPSLLLRQPRSLIRPLEIVSVIRHFQPDIIHLQHTSDPRMCVATWLLRDYPLVVTTHDIVWQHGAALQARELLVKVPLRCADAIILHGTSLKAAFVAMNRFVTEDRVHMVPHGVYTLYRRWQRPEWQEKPDSILFFGRMYPYKGLDVLLKAVPQIREALPRARIVVAGKGPELIRLKSDLEQNHVDCYDRFISNEEVARFFTEAAVVVLPYQEASQSGVAALAYAFGKPIVATSVGALPEMIEDGHTGYLVPPGDAKTLAQQVVRLLQHPEERQRMSENVRYLAEHTFSWECIAKRTSAIYEQIARDTGGGRP